MNLAVIIRFRDYARSVRLAEVASRGKRRMQFGCLVRAPSLGPRGYTGQPDGRGRSPLRRACGPETSVIAWAEEGRRSGGRGVG